MSGRMLLSRRAPMASGAAALALAPSAQSARAQGAPVASDETADALSRGLDERIEAAMVRHHVPGVAVGVWWQGRGAPCRLWAYPSNLGSICRPSSSRRIGFTQRTAVSGSGP
jgi:hypothetical protein